MWPVKAGVADRILPILLACLHEGLLPEVTCQCKLCLEAKAILYTEAMNLDLKLVLAEPVDHPPQLNSVEE